MPFDARRRATIPRRCQDRFPFSPLPFLALFFYSRRVLSLMCTATKEGSREFSLKKSRHLGVERLDESRRIFTRIQGLG
jgi:hypothetical protein